jgi:hypothetical protein
LKAWPVLGIVLMQALLALAHWFIFDTLVVFWAGLSPAEVLALRLGLSLLAFSFMAAALLGFSYSNPPVRVVYKIAAVWLGFLNFFFLAACASWLAWFALQFYGQSQNAARYRPPIATTFFALALAAGVYGLLNAQWIRIRRIRVELPCLPAAWRGRTALVVSDLHLGHVNGPGFSRRIARLAARLRPDIVFLPGDFFDGSKADADRLAAPFRELSPPFGIYFSSGNHEGFGSEAHYAEVLVRAGIRVLANERVTVDGLHILGVDYGDSTYPMRLRAFLQSLGPASGQATILLHHVPNRLPIVEQAGVSFQLSGHTHGGQLFPFNWFTRLVFGKYTYGLQRFGALQVYTSSGAGTWGPPMRVGTHPEIVLLTFE